MDLLLASGQFSLNQPDISFPIIGSRWAIGSMFLLHIILGAGSMGAVVLAPTYEVFGRLRNDPRLDRLAHAIAVTNLKLFGLGATLGTFAVMLLLGLYPALFAGLWSIFWLPMTIAFSSWLVTIGAELLYVFHWRRMSAGRKGAHIGLGYLGAASEHLFLFLIVGVDSYMLTPKPGQNFEGIFNGSFVPELLHRFVGNLSWVSFLVAAVAVVYAATARRPEDKAFGRWAARLSLLVGFLTLVPMAILGAYFAYSIQGSSPGAFLYSVTGPFAWLWLVQQGLFAVLLVGTSVYFLQTRERTQVTTALTALTAALAVPTLLPEQVYGAFFGVRYLFLALAIASVLAHWLVWRGAHSLELLRRSGQLVLGLTGLSAVLLFLLMGVIRETARGDYTVYGQLRASDSHGTFQPPNRSFYP